MKTHENRALFSKAVLRATACLFLAAGVGIGPTATFAETVGAMDIEAVQQQVVTVTGVVKDKSGEPIIGANILEKGTTNGVITNVDGQYTLKVKGANSVLSVSYIGYKAQEITVGNKRKIDITLADDTELLDEVVVIGYGTQKKGDVTSAIASVKAEDFLVGNFNNAGDLLKGKVAGLTIAKPSGDPNVGTEISLRGIVSVSGNASPLVLIDGVPGSMSTVPTENIASIDVLKDASAAAIYGTRGAGGVILITTKTGMREQKATATYSGYVSFSNWVKKADFMTPDDIRAGKTQYNDEGYDTDWLDAVSRTGVTHNHSFSITGGSSTTSYYGNVTYRNQQGVMKKSGNEDLSVSFDVSHWMFNNMLKVNLNIVQDNYKYLDKYDAYGVNSLTQIYRQAVIRNPTSPIWNEDGTYNERSLLQYYNPVSLQNESTGETKEINTRITGNVTFEPIKGWQTNLMLASHRSTGKTGSYNTKYHTTTAIGNLTGEASLSDNYDRTDYLELTSKYHATFAGKHRFEGMVGYSWSRNTYESAGMWNANFPTDYFGYNNMGAGEYLTDGKASMSSSKTESTLIGTFARISYGFDNRYNILASVRYEGSSKFGANHKWGAFPSVSLGWNIMNESFLESTRNWLNNLKLRAGYGVTGVIPAYSYQSIVRYSYSGGNYYRDGKWAKGLKALSNANPDLKWEIAKELNVGLDWGVLNDRLGGSVDFYVKNTSDMLFDYAVPSPPNLYTSTLANVGKMRNSGIEIMVRAIPIQTKDFEWNTALTMQHNANKLVSLSNDLYQTENILWQQGVGDPVSQYTHKVEVGKSFGEIWSLKAVGVSEKTGLFLIENPETGQAAEFYQEMRNDRDNWYQRMGNGIPKISMGWNNTFRYQNFDLTMQFTGQFGYKIINQQRVFYENNAHAYNKLKSAADAIGGIRPLSAQQSQVVTSYYIEDGDYLKLTNMTLGYTYDFKKSTYVKSIRFYGSIDNLFTITKYKGSDPELGSNNFWTAGVDSRDKYPTVRSFTVGLNVTF
ncbi:SusC/RagA family TonB-linked outer membrane protein [Bacteroides stercorirosoris]|jgi:TonB-linked SusC/RagA family outer membrane protein|uniref:TonB-linked outer membrane protein, SusC/RagA family n=1 Tax=Bacteroides stercorirosoris TaxID=871324 RepID=A0A1M6DU44_9BACE|nr:TonB-dependent receptor [Bacteroides stercorirosoris]SHI76722.1 TonB-linked outer membrane protein, SusC/RagA family [Bacteroides stercorirosoris]